MSTQTGPDLREANKALARRWFREGWELGNVEVAHEIFDPELMLRGRRVGPDGPRRSVLHRRAAFADMTVRIDLQVAEDDMVVTHFTARARHVGDFCGVPPTGRPVTATGIVIWRIENGRVVEDRNAFDRWAVVSQIDPAMAHARAGTEAMPR